MYKYKGLAFWITFLGVSLFLPLDFSFKAVICGIGLGMLIPEYLAIRYYDYTFADVRNLMPASQINALRVNASIFWGGFVSVSLGVLLMIRASDAPLPWLLCFLAPLLLIEGFLCMNLALMLRKTILNSTEDK